MMDIPLPPGSSLALVTGASVYTWAYSWAPQVAEIQGWPRLLVESVAPQDTASPRMVLYLTGSAMVASDQRLAIVLARRWHCVPVLLPALIRSASFAVSGCPVRSQTLDLGFRA